jgi:hypothetical protein
MFESKGLLALGLLILGSAVAGAGEGPSPAANDLLPPVAAAPALPDPLAAVTPEAVVDGPPTAKPTDKAPEAATDVAPTAKPADQATESADKPATAALPETHAAQVEPLPGAPHLQPNCPPAHCCGHCNNIWDWLTYRPLKSSTCGSCCHEAAPCCTPPLYAFFPCNGCGGCNHGCCGPTKPAPTPACVPCGQCCKPCHGQGFLQSLLHKTDSAPCCDQGCPSATVGK